jgi:hypothetical protein
MININKGLESRIPQNGNYRKCGKVGTEKSWKQEHEKE